MAELPYIPIPENEPRKTTNTVVWLLAILFGLLFCCLCLVPFCAIVSLAALGESIGNVFSEIIDDLVTPTPGLLLAWLSLF